MMLDARFTKLRKRARTDQTLDRISELPQELKIRILSRLEMKDAVKTGILSKPWKDLWTHCNNLVFDFHFPKTCTTRTREVMCLHLEKFMSFIDRTLMCCNCPNLNQFALNIVCGFYLAKSSYALVNKWVEFVLNKNVESLTLKNMDCTYSAPYGVFQSSSLVELYLESLEVITFSSNVNLTSLKHLSLRHMIGKDECINNILLGCPLLETLVLDSVHGIANLNIMSPRVRKLSIRSFSKTTRAPLLKIRAPWLQELEMSESFLAPHFEFIDVSSLLNATLLFTCDKVANINQTDNMVAASHLMWIKTVTGLLNSLCNVSELLIGAERIQVLSYLKLSVEHFPLLKCKCVTVYSRLWKYDLPGIAWLLENSPDLESLSIKVSEWQGNHHVLHQIKEIFSRKTPHLLMPNGNMKCLKNVKIYYEKCMCFGTHQERYDFELLGYILTSAPDLQKLLISSSKNQCYNDCKLKYFTDLSSKLFTTYLSVKEGAKWELKKKFSYYEPTGGLLQVDCSFSKTSLLLKD